MLTFLEKASDAIINWARRASRVTCILVTVTSIALVIGFVGLLMVFTEPPNEFIQTLLGIGLGGALVLFNGLIWYGRQD